MVQEKVVDKQVLAETQKQLDSSKAARDAAQAAVAAREADRVTSVANLGKAKIDVETEKAKVKVAEADERKAAAMLAYTKVTAPYDGVVTVRNANTWDYVQAVSGDKSTPNPSAIFVVARIDLVRVFVDVPEAYALTCRRDQGRGAHEALSGLQIPATVTRTSWAIRKEIQELRRRSISRSRTTTVCGPECMSMQRCLFSGPTSTPCRSDDPANADGVGQPDLLLSATQHEAVKTPVQPGISDGTWVEVDQMKIDDSWRKVTGDEPIIMADLSELTDGQQWPLRRRKLSRRSDGPRNDSSRRMLTRRDASRFVAEQPR